MKAYITKTGILVAAMLIVISLAHGQGQEGLSTIEKKQLTNLKEPATLYKGFFRITMVNDYVKHNKIIDEDGNKRYDSNSNMLLLSSSLILSYGVNDRLTVDIDLPFIYYSHSGNYKIEYSYVGGLREESYDRNGGGLSDLKIGTQYQIFTETSSRPSIRGSASVTLPTAEKNPTKVVSQDEYDEALGDGQFKVSAELQIRKIIYPYTISGFTYYEFQSDGEKAPTQSTNQAAFAGGNRWGVNVTGGMHLNDWLTVNGSFEYNQSSSIYFYQSSVDQIKSFMLSFAPNMNLQIKRFRISQNASILLAGKNLHASPSFGLGFGYTF